MTELRSQKSIYLAEDTISEVELRELSEWILAGNRLTKIGRNISVRERVQCLDRL